MDHNQVPQAYGRSVKAYKPKKANELAFKKGQTIALRERDEQQRLFHGEYVSSKRVLVSGWFPYDAVKICTQKEMAECMDQHAAAVKGIARAHEETALTLEESLLRRAPPTDLVRRGILSQEQIAGFGALPTAAASNKAAAPKKFSKFKLGGKRGASGAVDAAAVGAAAAASGVFGGTLGQSMFTSYTEFHIPPMVEYIFAYLREHALAETGVFRLSGSTQEVNELRDFWEARGDQADAVKTLELSKYQVHSITSVLKLFFRELADPLLTFELYDEWVATTAVANEKERVQRTAEVARKLPKINYALLKYLMELLLQIADREAENKMSADNLAIVFGPTLLKKQCANALADMLGNQDLVALVVFMINHFKEIETLVNPSVKRAPRTSRSESRGSVSRRNGGSSKLPAKEKATDQIQAIQKVDLDGQPLPTGWEMAVDGKGRIFFIDHATQKTSWKDPRTNQRYKQPAKS